MKNLFNRFALNASEAATDSIESLEAVVESLKDASSVEEVTEAVADMSIKWHPENFVPNLKYMGIGMLCIFVVIGVIILSIYLINLFANKPKREKKPKKNKKAEDAAE